VAAKTATTPDAVALSFLGYHPSLPAGCWLGYDQHRSLGSHETAGKIAGPIWVDFMKQSLGNSPVEEFQPPQGVYQALVNRKTGQPTSASDPEAFQEYFIKGHEEPPLTPSAPALSAINSALPQTREKVAPPQAPNQ